MRLGNLIEAASATIRNWKNSAEWDKCKAKCGNRGVLRCRVQVTKDLEVRKVIWKGYILTLLFFVNVEMTMALPVVVDVKLL